MVRAILDGRKTQTRRVVKFRQGAVSCCCEQPVWRSDAFDHWYCGTCGAGIRGASGGYCGIPCPYGVPGDTLWVRETWGSKQADPPGIPDGRKAQSGDDILFMADPASAAQWGRGLPAQGSFVWRPSIHMPRWASRITLRITDVRVERLNEISEADAIAEGLYKSLPTDEDRQWLRDWAEDLTGQPPTQAEIADFEEGVWMVPGVPQGWGLTKAERQKDQWAPTPQFAYRQIWNHINGPGSWDANPWVWAVTFEVLGNTASGRGRAGSPSGAPDVSDEGPGRPNPPQETEQ